MGGHLPYGPAILKMNQERLNHAQDFKNLAIQGWSREICKYTVSNHREEKLYRDKKIIDNDSTLNSLANA